MKKTLIISALLAGSLSAYSQGTLNFVDRQADMTIHIFAPQLATPGVETIGQQAGGGGVTADNYGYNGADANVFGVATTGAGATTPINSTGGTTVYTGGAIGNTLASNPTAAGAYNYNNGSDYTVELYAASGLNAAATALQPVSQYVSMIYTSSSLGGAFKSVTTYAGAGDPGIPNTSGGAATIALVCWYNAGGTIASYTAAQQAGVPTGISPLVNDPNLFLSSPATTIDMQGLQSFSLTSVPEPSTIALGVIGVSTLLFRRRK
jgi:hypothetical protein